MGQVSVVVIGAGLAGLVAATELVHAGLRVRCFEARDRVGGRTLSEPSRLGPVDLGATWFWPGQDDVAAIVRRVGSPTFAQHLAGDALLEQPTAGGAQVQRVAGNPIDAPSYRFAHGAQDLARRLAASLPDGVLALDTPVTSVARTAQGVQVRTTSADPALAAVRARCVVVAVPPALAVATIDFGSILDPVIADIAGRTAVWMGEVVKAVAVYDTPFWREQGLAGAAISYAGPFREVHDMSGPDAVPAAVFGFAPAELFVGASRDAIAGAFLEQLTRLLGAPAATPVAVEVKNWATERWTSPPADPPGPARSTASFGHPAFGTANPSDRVLWASTETSEHHPGHLAGAIDAGTRAARQATQHACQQ